MAGSLQACDGARVWSHSADGEVTWLDLPEALARQAELGLVRIPAQQSPLSSWRVERSDPLGLAQFENRLQQASFRRSPGTPRPPIVLEATATAAGFLLVRPLLDGRAFGPFLVDSAATHVCIDQRVAAELGWDVLGSTRVQGIGGERPGTWRASGTLALGAWSTSDQAVVELDLAPLSQALEQPVAGLLGLAAFGDRVVVIDATHARLELHDPRDPALRTWNWSPAALVRGAPCVLLDYAPGSQGWFRLDTGSNDTLTLHAAVGWRGLYPSRAAFLELSKVRLEGIGGSTSARRGNLPWLALGGQRITNVPASFVVEGHGPLADPNLAGTLGAGILRRFRVAIDLGARRVAFLPPGQ